MISEKEMMIVDAVNYYRGDINFYCGNGEANFISKCDPGTGFFASIRVSDRNKLKYCTIVEFDQCIREMSEGAFVPDAKPEFVCGQDVYIKSREDSSVEWCFGCYSLDGESAIILREGGYAYAVLDNISANPFKTKEEIELEEAEKEQIKRMTRRYEYWFSDESKATNMFTCMQELGDLPEILLPLESK